MERSQLQGSSSDPSSLSATSRSRIESQHLCPGPDNGAWNSVVQSEPKLRSDPARASIRFRDWTGDRSISTVGTNAGARSLPFQTWRPFKEAFAPEIVERALRDSVGPVRHIADPFGGSGTTALAAQFLGVKPTTIEVNPFLADLIEAKICPLDFDLAADAFGQVVECVARGCEPKRPVFSGASATFIEPGRDGRYIFSRAVARRLLAYRSAIELVRDEACQRLFRVVLGSTAIPASNVVVSGKGRRYRQRWRERESPPRVVDELFRDGVLRALHDLRRFAARRCLDYRVLLGDARRLAEEIGPHDLAVFSPPYPNSFDYTDVYNVELWAMGYLRSPEANKKLRHATLRSHVQLLRNFGGDGVRSATLSATIDALRDVRDALWNPHIPEMIAGYAVDLAIVLAGLSKGLRPRGRVYTVVGDSRYAGVDVPVATILAEIAQPLGYNVVAVEPCRSMRSSPQPGHELGETLVILERR